MLNIEVYPHATEETKMIRTRVFIEEQGFVTPEEEFDAYDAGGRHVLVRWQGEPIGTGRLVHEYGTAPETGKFGRIAVLPAWRKHEAHAGSRILAALEAVARQLELRVVYLSAQCQAQKFYERCGFTARGEVYDENGVPHVYMDKTL